MSLDTRRHHSFSILVFLVYCLSFSLGAFAQRVSFGVVAGTSLFDDFRSGTVFRPSMTTCPEQICTSATVFHSEDASRRLTFGPKVEVRLSNRFSLEAEALHRAIRRKAEIQYLPPLDFGNGVIIGSQPFSGTDYTWEFPVLANYKLRVFNTNSFAELGPTFRPAENNEQHGVTAGVGVEIRAKSLNIAPRVRYTHWIEKDRGPDPIQALVRPRPNQMALVVGISRPSRSSEWASAFGQEVSVGAVVGMGVTDDFRSKIDFIQGVPGSRSFSESKSPIVGLMVESELLKNLLLEVDGLYRPLHLTDENLISIPELGVRPGRISSVTVLTWEFPLLVKYKLPIAGAKPFVEVGPSFRATGNLNGTNPSHHGFTSGIGVQPRSGKIKISPAVRYTRWATDRALNTRTNRNQVELVVGFSF